MPYVQPAGSNQAAHTAAAARALATYQNRQAYIAKRGGKATPAATAQATLALRQFNYQLHFLPTGVQHADLEELQHISGA